MAFVENLDFLNSNSVRSFPIKEGLSCTSTDGFVIPTDFMVDMTVSASSDVSVGFYVSRLYNYPDVVIIELTDTSDVVLGTFTVLSGAFSQYKLYTLAPSTDYTGANGKLTAGSLSSLQALPSGIYVFDRTATELESRCVVPSRTAINRLVFTDEKSNSLSFTGSVNILARNNLRFRKNGSTIILDAGDGLGLNKDCGATLAPITTINNVGPDANGNFSLLGLDCAQFSSVSDPPGLSLDDSCCKPCMGCEEIGQLTERAMQVEADLLKLRDYFTNLQQLITQFQQTTNYTCEC